MNHTTMPQEVWVLPPGLDEDPRQVREEGELKEIFTQYDDTGFEPRLEWLYESIKCDTIDFRDLPGMGHLWFDDEGKLKEDPRVNLLATMLYQACYSADDPIVGTVILVVDPAVEGGKVERFVRLATETLKQARAQEQS